MTGFGTGGTLQGVGRVLREKRPDTKIIVAEPELAPMLTSGEPQPASRQPPGLEAASDAGLEPGFHPEDHRGRRSMHALIDEVLTIPAPTR